MRQLFLSLLLLCSACAGNPAPETKPSPYDNPAIAIIHTDEDFCTAFSIDIRAGLWVTAQHCVEGLGSSPVINGKEARFLAQDDESELALYIGPVARGINHATTFPRVGEEVMAPCYPGGVPFQLPLWNRIAAQKAVDTDNGKAYTIVTGVGYGAGCSGGPVLNKSGEVVGVIQKVWLTPAMTGWITPLDVMMKYLGDHWRQE